MRVAIITVAGLSSRFNKDISDKNKVLKCLYYEENPKQTLIYQLIKKVSFTDLIVIVGGYKFEDLKEYLNNYMPNLNKKILLVNNLEFSTLSSGYSLFLGIESALKNASNIEEVLFVEGDLDIDEESFLNIIYSDKNVLTFNYEPIYSNKAVVLYKNNENRFCYAFNKDHGLLEINGPFECIFNSGQIWKFNDIISLKKACSFFKENCIDETNLSIIQKYLDLLNDDKDIEVIGLKHWVNCNTREDYKLIKQYWDNND